MLEFPLLMVFPACMVFAAAFDLFTMTIPNKISLALIAAFLAVAPLSGMSLTEFGLHLAAGAGVLAVGFFLFSRGWLGGGDAKLLAACALWLGNEQLLLFLVMTSIFGGFLSLAVLAFRVYVPGAFVHGPQWLVRLHGKQSGIPYGIAVGGAALWIYPQTPWFTALAGA